MSFITLKKMVYKLIDNFHEIGLVTETVKYTYGDILKRVQSYVTMFKLLELDSKDIVGIHTQDPFSVVSSFFACLTYGCSFALLDSRESNSETLTKIVLANEMSNTWLLLSEDNVDSVHSNILTINPINFKVISKGIEYKKMSGGVAEMTDKLLKGVEDILMVEKNFTVNSINFMDFNTSKSKQNHYGIVYHTGISKDPYNGARIPLYAINNGIKEVVESNDVKIKGSVLMLEPLVTLYNLINGVIVPLIGGKTVCIGNGESYYSLAKSAKLIRANTLFIEAARLEFLLTTLAKETVPQLRTIRLIRNLAIFKRFNAIFGRNVRNIIITGKITQRKDLNCLKKNIISLYVKTEVATYIASGTFTWLPRHIGLKLKPNAKVAISLLEKQDVGEFQIWCEDMLDVYLSRTHTISNILATQGMLRTGDIGYLKGDTIFIMDKVRNIFINNGNLILESGIIEQMAREFDFIKEAIFTIYEGSASLIIEPDFTYLENSKITPPELRVLLKGVRKHINNRVNEYSKLRNILIYENPNGLPRKGFKILR